jgi:hypothetical protein
MLLASCYLHLLCESIPQGTIEQSGKAARASPINSHARGCYPRTHADAATGKDICRVPISIHG